jgi:hypothetical protein
VSPKLGDPVRPVFVPLPKIKVGRTFCALQALPFHLVAILASGEHPNPGNVIPKQHRDIHPPMLPSVPHPAVFVFTYKYVGYQKNDMKP